MFDPFDYKAYSEAFCSALNGFLGPHARFNECSDTGAADFHSGKNLATQIVKTSEVLKLRFDAHK